MMNRLVGMGPVCAVWIGLLLAPAMAGAQAPLAVSGLGKPTVALDGGWKFHTGDAAEWAAEGFDDANWQGISPDKSWAAQEKFPNHYDYQGMAWYRLHVTLDAATAGIDDLALYVPRIQDAYDMYWNGRLILSHGHPPPHAVWYRDIAPRIVPLADLVGTGKPTAGVLAIRVWKAPYASNENGDKGGLTGVPLIGSARVLKAFQAERWNLFLTYVLVFSIVFIPIGLVCLLSFLGWLRDRQQWLLLWLAGFTFGLFLLLFAGTGGLSFLPWTWSAGAIQVGAGFEIVSLGYLLIWLFKLNDNQRILRWVRVVAICFLVADLLDGLLFNFFFQGSNHPMVFYVGDAITTVFALACTPLPIFLMFAARKKQLGFANWLVGVCASVVSLSQVIQTLTTQGIRFTHWTINAKLNGPIPTIAMPLLLIVSLVYAVYRYTAEQTRQKAALEQEFQSARELQEILIPEALPEIAGFHLTSAYRPAQQVGGDFFQIIPLREKETLVVLGDVSGKGLKAAMTVSLLVGTVRTLAEACDDPATILRGLNRRLEGRLQGGFVTALVMRVSGEGGVVIANAGHLPPYLNAAEMELPPALPLGLAREAEYENVAVRLKAGDRLTLYTDGLLEARAKDGELFGFARVAELMAGDVDAAGISAAAVEFGQDDDITALTLTFA